MNHPEELTTDRVEVLAPAGSFSILKEALAAGANAVYLSGKRFGARAYAPNFTDEELHEALSYAHLRGCHIHLTVNTLMKEEEMGEELYRYLAPLVADGLDAVIVQDLGVLTALHAWFPDLPLHASTQMSVTSAQGARLLAESGVRRVIPARELSLPEIAAIAAVPGLETEVFVHGAMCYAYSGRCLFSSTLGERSGNRGTCAQPCRLAYRTEDSKQGQYLLSMQDLCALDKIPELIKAGVCSFKVEGRMKDAGYVAAVTSLYRRYVDRLLSHPADHQRPDKKDMAFAASYARSISGPGYLEQRNGPDMITPLDASYRAGGEKAPTAAKRDLVKVDADLNLHVGRPARLKLRVNGLEAEALSNLPAEPARKAPLGRKDVCERLAKRDQWPFVLEWKHVNMDDQAFLPVASLNAMRRSAYAALSERLLAGFRREMAPMAQITAQSLCDSPKAALEESETDLHVLASTAEQVDVLFDEPYISVIIAESSMLNRERTDEWIRRAHSAGKPKRLLAALPHIYRPQGDKAYIPEVFGDDTGILRSCDGVLVRSLDELAWLREHRIDVPIYTDYLVYVFNSYSIYYLAGEGVRGCCYSPEMSRHDISRAEIAAARIQAPVQREIPVYGKQIRMLSAQCIVKNTHGCTRTPVTTQLTDRRGVKFSVQNRCDSCYNILYNSVPVSLHNQLSDIRRLPGLACRMDLTDESPQTVRELIRLFTQPGARECDYAYTKGHFERSVL